MAVRYRLDGVVTVVDAVNAAAEMDAQPEAMRQVRWRTGWCCRKPISSDAASVATLTARLRRLNPAAPLLTALRGETDPAALLNCGLFESGGKIADVRAWLDAEALVRPTHGHNSMGTTIPTSTATMTASGRSA